MTIEQIISGKEFTGCFLTALAITLIIPLLGLIIHGTNRMIVGLIRMVFGNNIAFITANYLTFPGVVVHEISHALMAVLTGAKIVEFRPFWPDKEKGELGHVTITPRGNFLIRSIQSTFSSSAPVIFGLFTTAGLIYVVNTAELPTQINVALYYLVFSIIIHSTMSIQDIKVMLRGIWVIFTAILAICYLFNINIMNLTMVLH